MSKTEFRLALLVENQQCLEIITFWLMDVKNVFCWALKEWNPASLTPDHKTGVFNNQEMVGDAKWVADTALMYPQQPPFHVNGGWKE